MTTALSATGVGVCIASAFATPTVPGLQVLSIEASLVANYSVNLGEGRYASRYAFNVSGFDFCNVSLWYTHPGYDDHVNVQIRLPTTEKWNGRFQGTGGGAFVAGLQPEAMDGGVAEGYATASSDGGHTTDLNGSQDWTLKSPGNINWPLVINFGSQSLYDFTLLGQAITESYYGRPADYSYFTGCSTGGRQALMLAQRWPELYDGILAGAPGVNHAQVIAGGLYTSLRMLWRGQIPRPCEMEALTRAAVESCDELDGVKDGVISSPELCRFDPHRLVNATILCDGRDVLLSAAAAEAAQDSWTGSRSSDGSLVWYGLNKEAPLDPIAATACDAQGLSCAPNPFFMCIDWLKYFIYRDPGFDWRTVTPADYDRIVQLSSQIYDSPLGTRDPDLRLFGRTGKLLMWHGLADPIIAVNGSREYYDRAAAVDPGVGEYFRYFEAPGVHHCRTGPGPYPGDALLALIDWVEKGKKPETLHARQSAASNPSLVFERELCAYPLVQRYKGFGDVIEAGNYECA